MLITQHLLTLRSILLVLQDMAVHASRPYSANSVLGVYRSLTMLPEEELALRHNPPADYPFSTVNWRQAIDAYAAGMGSTVLVQRALSVPGTL